MSAAERTSRHAGAGGGRSPGADRLRRFWRRYRLLITGGLGVVAFVLGLVGFDRRPLADRLYLTIQLFSFGSGANAGDSLELQVARWLAPATAAYAGLRALSALFRDQVSRLRLRWGKSRHVVVCGLGRSGLLLARSFDADRHRVAAIEKDPANPAIAECRTEGITVLVGDATDDVLLDEAGVSKAGILLAACGDDGVNASVAMAARAVARAPGRGPLQLFVQIDDLELCRMLNERAAASDGHLEFLNSTESAPPALLVEFAPIWPPGPAGPPPPPHIVVAGMGGLGHRLVVQAARQWKVTQPKGTPPMRATLLDDDATARRQSLMEDLPDIERVCQIIAVDVDPSAPVFVRRASPFDGQDHPTAVFVCLDDDARSLRAALALRTVLPRPAPVVVCTTGQAGLADLLGSEEGRDIHGFALLERACRAEAVLKDVEEVLARAIHEEYVRLAKAGGATPATNPSVVGWRDLPVALKDSNRDQARDIGRKLATRGWVVVPWSDPQAEAFFMTEEQVEELARMEHDRWLQERRAAGWAPGPVKDAAAKLHPALVPWEDLSEAVKDLDRNAVRAIPVVLARAGLATVRDAGGDGNGTGARLHP